MVSMESELDQNRGPHQHAANNQANTPYNHPQLLAATTKPDQDRTNDN